MRCAGPTSPPRGQLAGSRQCRCWSTAPIPSVRAVDAYVVTVRFAKTDTNQCVVTGWTRDRKPFPVSHMAGASRMPHDLATFVIEQHLSISGGFFNLVAHGAVFRSSGRR